MSEHEADLHARMSKLEEAFLQQSAGVLELATNTNTLAEQLFALFAVNTSLVAVLREQGPLDVDQIHARVMVGLSAEQRAGVTGLHVNAILGKLVPDERAAPPKPTADELRERAKARFTVFEGGGQGSKGSE
ncbi:hypothetical protein MKK88_03390 [Methylobacterium sp. E-005]|uniref:hypothetical protein n=1 Tax=Methylobacterium sp. E-005 TaxID=2836549 RepID=UPI001FBB5839|nr:hypothetical protein [Methylobacterium sp. E-005]MCJ2085040.1 hypothetical protein [Methylobacterium sp. E-005]